MILLYILFVEMIQQLTVRYLEKPFEKTVDSEINWVCESFGFYEKIDKKKTSAAIFKIIIMKAKDEEGVTTKELGEHLGISRVSALNHVKKLMTAGLVEQDGMEYHLRSGNLQRTLREMRRDIIRIFNDIDLAARDIDAGVGLKRGKIDRKTQENNHFI